jgi:hypothetical protein
MKPNSLQPAQLASAFSPSAPRAFILLLLCFLAAEFLLYCGQPASKTAEQVAVIDAAGL